MSVSRKYPRILSLDGGGARGLSSLLVLRDVMGRLAIKEKSPYPIRPCERFDLIIGTGTGGISALFLGRMRMTVDEAIDAYEQICTTFMDAKNLDRTMKHITAKFLKDQDARLEDPSHSMVGCATAVLAATASHAASPPHVFRSYKTAQPASRSLIHQVALAAVSTPGLFASAASETCQEHSIDAGIAGYNNPTEQALDEVIRIWPRDKPAYVLSIGTGLQPIVSVGERRGDVMRSSELILQSCELVHDRVARRQHREDWPYFRFNVDRGLDSVGVKEWKWAGFHGRLTDVTEAYLRWDEVETRLNLCASALYGEKLAPSIQPKASSGEKYEVGKFLPLLNPAPKIFHGREEYVTRATNSLSLKHPVFIAILGPGGIGKTSIARTIMHDREISRKFQDHRRFISCEAMTSVSSLVDAMIAAFQVHSKAEERRMNLMTFLTSTYFEKPLLLVLDNFETLWDAHMADSEVFLEILGAVRSLSLMVTMRGSMHPGGLNWTHTFVVEPLSPKAARATFIGVSGREDSELTELLNAVDHVPLAITLMAHLRQTETSKRLLERWNNEQTGFLKRGDSDRLHSVDVSIRLSIESPQMKRLPEALLLLQVIAVLPAGVFEGDLPKVCPRISNPESVVVTLIQAALAYHDLAGTLRVLSPIREYVRKYHPPPGPHLLALQSFHLKLASKGRLLPGSAGYQQAMAMLTRAKPNIEAVLYGALSTSVAQNRHSRRAIRAALNWSYFLRWTRPGAALDQQAVKVAEQAPGHPKLAECLYSLGETQRLLGEHVVARGILERAHSQFQVVHDRRGAAWCLWSLGEIRRIDGDYEAARMTLIEAQREFHAINNENGFNTCLWNLAEIHRETYDFDRARRTLATARAGFEAIGSKRDLVKIQWSVGEIHRMLNEYKDARTLFTRARADCKSIGDQFWAAWFLQRLGDIQRKMHDLGGAQKSLEKSRNEFESVENRRGVAECCGSLAEIQSLLGNTKAAQLLFEEAREDHQQLRNRNGAAWCLRGLGDVQFQLGQHQTALDTLSEARDEFQATGDRRGMSRCLLGIGDAHRMLGNYDEAQEVLTEALEQCSAAGDRYKQARCLLLCSYVSRDEGNFNDARTLATQAKGRFERLGAWTRTEQDQCREVSTSTEV